MTDIFISRFTLRFKIQEIEDSYQKARFKNIKKYNIVYSIINLAILFVTNMIYAFTFQSLDAPFWFYIKYTSYMLTSVQVLCLVLSIVCTKFICHKWITYFNVGNIVISNMTFRMYLALYAKVDYLVFNLAYIFQQIYTMIWYFTDNLDFLDGFWLYVAIPIVSYIYYCGEFPLAIQFRFPISAVIMMVAIFISYFYIAEKKKSFYYNFMNEATIKSYRSIIQNMNSGFVSIKNSKITKVNRIIFTHLTKIMNCREDASENIQIIINENVLNDTNSRSEITHFENLKVDEVKLLLNALFKNLIFDSLEEVEVEMTDYERAIEYLKNYNYSTAVQKDGFIFLGTKEFKYENLDPSYYEIFGRHCSTFKEDKDSFEFLFNDVSKTKITESINANMKYKTIFLSKVAHEFKNPLICVSELVDQVNDQIDAIKQIHALNLGNTPSRVKETLSHIKSISEYLLMLVKDLDFFSLKQPGSTNKIKLEKENVELGKVINYCNNITNVLLKKYQKESNIKFQVDCQDKLLHKEVFTDELRLKQLLINLLSNSVKYTYNGGITLKVTEEEENVNFSVVDTGKGLSEDQLKRLKSNIDTNREIGAHSSSLGFSIIREILDLLGSQLEYDTVENEGSVFSFKIKMNPFFENEDSMLISSKRSDVSVDENATIVHVFKSINHADRIRRLSGATEVKSTFYKASLLQTYEDLPKLENDQNTDYFMIVDDEQMTRKATIRIINNFHAKKESNRKLIILEGKDGIECLNMFYECIKKGIKLSCIISDQTMDFMNGLTSAKILNDITKSKGFRHVPFIILTAYENIQFGKDHGIDKSYTKPISLRNLEEIYDHFI